MCHRRRAEGGQALPALWSLISKVAGFLDAGKTNFINGILEDGFARQDPTLLLCCEEGEEEYEKNALDNVTVITIEDEEDLKCSYLKELEKQYHPKQVLIEYNGMWQMERLYREVLPANWVLYQIMTFVYAPTFEMYAKNMGQLMMEKITNADMLVFNRCTPELRDALRKRNLRMVNRRADIYLEMEDGTSEDYLTGDECPFDLNQDLIDVPDDDFGVWYVDVMDHPDRWAGKMVHMKLIMCHSKKYPGIHCPGRFVMTCCENDPEPVPEPGLDRGHRPDGGGEPRRLQGQGAGAARDLHRALREAPARSRDVLKRGLRPPFTLRQTFGLPPRFPLTSLRTGVCAQGARVKVFSAGACPAENGFEFL